MLVWAVQAKIERIQKSDEHSYEIRNFSERALIFPFWSISQQRGMWRIDPELKNSEPALVPTVYRAPNTTESQGEARKARVDNNATRWPLRTSCGIWELKHWRVQLLVRAKKWGLAKMFSDFTVILLEDFNPMFWLCLYTVTRSDVCTFENTYYPSQMFNNRSALKTCLATSSIELSLRLLDFRPWINVAIRTRASYWYRPSKWYPPLRWS